MEWGPHGGGWGGACRVFSRSAWQCTGVARKGTQHCGESLGGPERGHGAGEGAPAVQGRLLGEHEHRVRCRGRGTVSGSRFCAASGPCWEGLAVPFPSPWLEREAEDMGALPALRPCQRRRAGRGEASLPRTALSHLHPAWSAAKYTRGRHGPGPFMERHLEGLPISSPAPPPRSRPRVEWCLFPAGPLSEQGSSRGCRRLLALPPLGGACLTEKTSWKKLNRDPDGNRFLVTSLGHLDLAVPRSRCPVSSSYLHQYRFFMLEPFDYISSRVTERAWLTHVAVCPSLLVILASRLPPPWS